MEPEPSLLRSQSHVSDGGVIRSSLIRLAVGEEHCLRTRLERLAFFSTGHQIPCFHETVKFNTANTEARPTHILGNKHIHTIFAKILFRFLLRKVHKIKNNGENIRTFQLKATYFYRCTVHFEDSLSSHNKKCTNYNIDYLKSV
jgi:hypothetical protein